jgi:DNA-binding NarL/FixJ family response regulator
MVAGTDIKVVAEASTGKEAVRLNKKHRPDVVMLGVRMPEVDGLNSLGRIKLDHPNQPVLMFSAYDNPVYVARAVALGANGYVLKGATREKLLDALRIAARGESAWTRRDLWRIRSARIQPQKLTDIEVSLTPRESDVLHEIALGLTNKEIAQALHISYATVKEHVCHIIHKVGVSDRTQVAIWAARKGIV